MDERIDYLTTPEMLERLADLGLVVTERTLRKWPERHDDCPHPIKPARDLLWPAEALEQWCEKTGRLDSDDVIEARSHAKASIAKNRVALDELEDR